MPAFKTESGGYTHGLKYYFDSASYSRLKAVYSDPTTATDAQASTYAARYFEYDSNQRVTKTVVHLPKGMKFGYKAFAKCNPAKLSARGISGCPKKSIVGKGNLTADGRPVVETPVTGSVTSFNGTYSGGKPRYLLGISEDVTEHLKFEEQLKESERHTREIVDTANDAFVVGFVSW